MPTTAAAACRLFLITNWWLPKLEIGYRYYGYSGYSAGVWAQTVKLSSLFLYHTALVCLVHRGPAAIKPSKPHSLVASPLSVGTIHPPTLMNLN